MIWAAPRLAYFLLQRVVGVNRSIPWRVHWSSVVNRPKLINRKDRSLFPGSLPEQYIQGGNGINFGKNVRLGPGVKIVSANHDLYDYEKHAATAPIEIGDNCWIGADAVILPGVRLGNHVVVLEGSVVTKSFEDNCLIAGTPAVLLRELKPYQG